MGSNIVQHKSGVETLQSAKQRHLLDTIDRLRNCGLDSELSLPQLVVCGDQSSGKSSVLEALTEIRFPRADEVCTRFATEIILRRAPAESLVIKIIPDRGRPSEEQKAIEDFSYSVDDFSSLTTQLAWVIEEAKHVMGIGEGSDVKVSQRFARDILRIEISGPGRPQLTVVDLPGLIQNDDDTGDKELVDDLTMNYIEQSRTICLAVVSATYDADHQRILTFVKKADPLGVRSMGIITKVDRLPPGSGSEKAFIDLARNKNKKYFFKIGWHVLRNRNHEESDVSFEKRNRNEAEFFEISNFKDLPKETVGIGAFAERLSTMLYEHSKRELPAMRTEVERMMSDTKDKLMSLGGNRATVEDCRDYLMDLSGRLYEITKNALHGNYEGIFFDNTEVTDFSVRSKFDIRRLRAIVQQTNETFSQRVRQTGYTYHIARQSVETEGLNDRVLSKDEIDLLRRSSDSPVKLPYAVAVKWVRQTIARNRGRELQGNYNPLVISELFRIQSKRWKCLAKEHIECIAKICSDFVYDAVSESCTVDVRDNVWTQQLEETLRAREALGFESLEKIMRSYLDHPINHNHYYTDIVRKIRQEREQKRLDQAFQLTTINDQIYNEDLGKLEYVRRTDAAACMEEITRSTEADMVLFSCEEALDCTRAIYKVKQKVFIDVVLTLVVEEHIVRDLEHIYSPKLISRMTGHEVLSIASEPEGLQRERMLYQSSFNRLQDGHKLLKSVMSNQDAYLEAKMEDTYTSDD